MALTSSPLLRLPAEVRNAIYEYSLTARPHSPSIGNSIGRDPNIGRDWVRMRTLKWNRSLWCPFDEIPTETSLLLTCRQIYQEAHLLPLSLNVFQFEGFSEALEFLYRLNWVQRQSLRFLSVFLKEFTQIGGIGTTGALDAFQFLNLDLEVLDLHGDPQDFLHPEAERDNSFMLDEAGSFWSRVMFMLDKPQCVALHFHSVNWSGNYSMETVQDIAVRIRTSLNDTATVTCWVGLGDDAEIIIDKEIEQLVAAAAPLRDISILSTSSGPQNLPFSLSPQN